jgi:hypothetical protein
LFEVGRQYKFEIISNSQSIFYTGTILLIDNVHIKIQTIKNEVVFLKIENIVQSMELPDSKLGRSLIE